MSRESESIIQMEKRECSKLLHSIIILVMLFYYETHEFNLHENVNTEYSALWSESTSLKDKTLFYIPRLLFYVAIIASKAFNTR